VLQAGRAGISSGSDVIAIVGTPAFVFDGPIQQARQAAVGFEPTNNGFANRRLSPLGYAADSHDTLQCTPILRVLQKNLVRIFWLVCGRIFLQGFKGRKRLILRQKGLSVRFLAC
jgi:hypothetical protein